MKIIPQNAVFVHYRLVVGCDDNFILRDDTGMYPDSNVETHEGHTLLPLFIDMVGGITTHRWYIHTGVFSIIAVREDEDFVRGFLRSEIPLWSRIFLPSYYKASEEPVYLLGDWQWRDERRVVYGSYDKGIYVHINGDLLVLHVHFEELIPHYIPMEDISFKKGNCFLEAIE